MSGESISHKVISKANVRLNFLYRKNKYSTPSRLLCNALIQSHFDYASSVWHPNLSKKMKNEIRASVSLYSWIKWHIYLKKKSKQ